MIEDERIQYLYISTNEGHRFAPSPDAIGQMVAACRATYEWLMSRNDESTDEIVRQLRAALLAVDPCDRTPIYDGPAYSVTEEE